MSSAVPGLYRNWRSSVAATAVATLILMSSAATRASEYVGESFLQVPELAGGWPGGPHEGWVKFEAQYWGDAKAPQYVPPGNKRTFFSGPAAPR
jgi:hypothetical protein